MATITVDDDAVTIELAPWEKVAGLLRSQRIPLTTIESSSVEEAPRRVLAGLRAPGLSVPFGAKVGTWRGQGRRCFVRIDGASPAVHLEVRGGRFDAYLIGTADAHQVNDRIVRALRGRE